MNVNADTAVENDKVQYQIAGKSGGSTRNAVTGTGEVSRVRSDHSSRLEYILIGLDTFETSVAPLLEWKTKKGVPAKFKSLEDIYSEFAGAGGDELTKIRQYLISEYSSHPELKWVLLLGDSEVIPLRMLYAGAETYNMKKFYESDHYLCALNGSWDTDSDGIYGEQREDEDWHSELYIGRIPVNTADEAALALEKILSYERIPPEGDWFSSALIMGSLMDAPNVDDLLHTTYIDEGYNDYKDNAYEVKKKSLDFFPEYYDITELYDYDRITPGQYTLENDTLTRPNAVAEFNKGYALINFAGQARFNGDSLMQYDYADGTGTYQYHRTFAWKELYHYEDAEKASNGGMLPFMMMPTCDAANFTEENDSNLEVLFTAPGGGTIGMISSTGVSHRGESYDGNSYGNWWEDLEFWKIFFQQDCYQPGEALAKLKSSFAENILASADTNSHIYREAIIGNLEGLTLLGDPEVPIWTNTPGSLDVIIKNLTTGSVNIEITVIDNHDSSPVQDALVALSNQDLYLYGTTDETGTITFSTKIEFTGGIDLTVTAHNYIPHEIEGNIQYARPQIEPIENITVNEDYKLKDHIELEEIITDADTSFDDLIIEVLSDPVEGGAVIDDNNIDIIPDSDWSGLSYITLKVADGVYDVYMNFSVNVLPVNDPPELLGVPVSVTAWEDQLFTYTNISVYDPDSTVVTLYDDSDLFEISESTGRISFIPGHDDVGSHMICIYATDSFDISKECINITIFEMPDVPSITPLGPLSVKTGEKYQFDIIAYDDDGGDLTYSIEPDWISIDSKTGKVTIESTSDKVGEHDVTVFVSDGTHTSSDSFTLNVSSSTDYKYISIILFYIVLIMLIVLGFVLKRYKLKKERTGDSEPETESPKEGQSSATSSGHKGKSSSEQLHTGKKTKGPSISRSAKRPKLPKQSRAEASKSKMKSSKQSPKKSSIKQTQSSSKKNQ